MNLTPREIADVESALGLAVEPVAPSPDLKASIMAKIAQLPQLPALELTDVATDGDIASDAGMPIVAADIGVATAAASNPFVQGKAQQRAQARWFSRPVTILAAAAAAVALFVGGTFVGLQVNPSGTVDAEAQSLAVLTSAGDLQRASAEVAGGGEATLIWSLDQRKSAILVNGLPALSAGKTYQLWYIGGEGAIPAGTFEPNVSATSWRVLDGAMSAGDTVGVTVEPTGGSSKPTTDPIVKLASS